MNLAAIKKNAPSRRDLEGANHGTIRFLLPFVSPSVWLLGGRAARAAGPPVSLNPQQGVLKLQVRLMSSPRGAVHATHPLCVIRPPTPATASISSHSSAASSHRSANFSPHTAHVASLQPGGKRSTG